MNREGAKSDYKLLLSEKLGIAAAHYSTDGSRRGQGGRPFFDSRFA